MDEVNSELKLLAYIIIIEYLPLNYTVRLHVRGRKWMDVHFLNELDAQILVQTHWASYYAN